TGADPIEGVLQRAWVACYEPEHVDAARGIAVLLPGMFGTPRWIIEDWTARLVGRGWVVVRLVTQPSRFTEFVDFDLGARRAVRVIAEEVASVIDRRLWACGSAVEAACRVVLSDHPELRGRPRIAMGLSGGAIMLPVVVAFEPDRYEAMVTVAGGADFMSVAATSNYAPFISAARFREGARPATRARIEAIASAYREVSRIDPYVVAPGLDTRRVLMVHAERDRAVPAAFGDVLWERLGRPERWSFPVGHEMIALMLPNLLDRMIDWAESASVGREPESGREPGR
ncbi:MAG: prolyl oligopeptidase family serine peptidase, partial [Planctomycetota bacterium]